MPDEQGLVSTDEAILDAIGEGDELSTEATSEAEDAGTSETAEEQTLTAGSEQDTEGGNVEEQQGQARGPQDLLDKDGNLVATGGKERRFYETAQREKSRGDNLQRELDTIKSQMEAVNAAGNLGTQYSLTPEELTTGAQIISAYKENPVETLQYMLTQAQAAGHNIDALGGGSLDTQAIKQMIDNAVKPLVSEQQGKQETELANQEALNQYNAFNSKHPDAAIHENSIARLLQDDSTLSPEAAYLKLQNFYLQKGLDWNKSLDTLQQEHNAQKVNSPAVNTQQQLPNGKVAAINTTDTAQVADVNTSTDQIIREAMAEAGIN